MNKSAVRNTVQASDYTALLAAADNYVRVKAVDTPRSIYLINKAKGGRTVRDFGDAAHTTGASVSRTLNGIVCEFRKSPIAGFVSGADAKSGVSLDDLMDAQGYIR